MRRTLVGCLFFFCFVACAGCKNIAQVKMQETNGEVSKKEETGKEVTEAKEKEPETEVDAEKDEEKEILVLTYGKNVMTGMAATICDKIGAVHLDLTKRNEEGKEELREAIEEAEYILIGTDKQISEFEFMVRNLLAEEMLEDKKIALFLVDQEKDAELFEQNFTEWYPRAELLPTFTMQLGTNIQDELGRMNGWLTTILTYDRLEE